MEWHFKNTPSCFCPAEVTCIDVILKFNPHSQLLVIEMLLDLHLCEHPSGRILCFWWKHIFPRSHGIATVLKAMDCVERPTCCLFEIYCFLMFSLLSFRHLLDSSSYNLDNYPFRFLLFWMNERGKFLEHFSSCMHEADGLVGPHGPWIMFVRTISDRSGSKSGS